MYSTPEKNILSSDNLRFLLLSVMIICLIGNLMVFSSSYIYARENFSGAFHFFNRQILYSFFGLLIMYMVGKTKFTFWIKYSKALLILSTVFLTFTFVPGLGVQVKGASRWVNLGVITFQPGEILKYTTLLYSIYFFEVMHKESLLEKVKSSAVFLFPLAGLILQPDFGTFFICCSTIIFIAFMSRFDKKYFLGFLGVASVSMTLVLLSAPYRLNRLITFLDPWKDPKSSGFQIIQSFLAFSNGGVLGRGFGNSDEKLFYLPEAHNDFIFSVLGEELGFIGVVVFVLVLMAFIYNGLKLSFSKNDNVIKSLLIAGVVFLIGFQSFLNIGVVLGLLPTKGLNLPFVSFGGSSLVCNFFGIGLIISGYRSMNSST